MCTLGCIIVYYFISIENLMDTFVYLLFYSFNMAWTRYLYLFFSVFLLSFSYSNIE